MEKEEVYVFIGELAIALYVKKIKISLSSLNSILVEHNAGYDSKFTLNQNIILNLTRNQSFTLTEFFI